MGYKKIRCVAFSALAVFSLSAQQKKVVQTGRPGPADDTLAIPVTDAVLGVFPYFKTLPNFYANDSATIDLNKTYFYDGKKFFAVEGKVSRQNLDIKDPNGKTVSEFGCIQAFDKVVAALGGVKVFTGKFPEDRVKAFAGADMVELGSRSQIAPSGYYGIVEYVIKTPEKEVWAQLQPYSLGSHFYSLLIVERETPLLRLNTNRENNILGELAQNKKSTLHWEFEPDGENLLSRSKGELLSLIGVFQAHPDWKIRLECHEATIGGPEYTQQLTSRRAEAIKRELMGSGVGNSSIDAKGMGDRYPLAPNNTESGRWKNTRIEVVLE